VLQASDGSILTLSTFHLNERTDRRTHTQRDMNIHQKTEGVQQKKQKVTYLLSFHRAGQLPCGLWSCVRRLNVRKLPLVQTHLWPL
jgi:hypothetical protein